MKKLLISLCLFIPIMGLSGCTMVGDYVKEVTGKAEVKTINQRIADSKVLLAAGAMQVKNDATVAVTSAQLDDLQKLLDQIKEAQVVVAEAEKYIAIGDMTSAEGQLAAVELFVEKLKSYVTQKAMEQAQKEKN